jgi:hypothetical protein
MARYKQWQRDSASVNALVRFFRGDSSSGNDELKRHSYAAAICQELIQSGVDPQKLPSLEALVQLLADDKPASLIDELRKSLCTGANHFRPQIPECRSELMLRAEPEKIRKALDLQLSKSKPQPTAITYCSSILTQWRIYEGAAKDGVTKERLLKSDCRGHSSLVIGRRMNPSAGKCEYLVRNSWGTSCYPYSRDWSCENGNIWVEADVLTRNTYGYFYLEE